MIPKPFRDRLKLHPGDTLEWSDAGGGVAVKKRSTREGLTFELIQRLGRVPSAERNREKVSYAIPA